MFYPSYTMHMHFLSMEDPGPEWFGPPLDADDLDWALAGADEDEPAWGADIFASGGAHDIALDDVDELTRELRRLTARQCELFAPDRRRGVVPRSVVRSGPDLDPAWTNPRDLTTSQARAERTEMAQRAAVCDLAVRLHLSRRGPSMGRPRTCTPRTHGWMRPHGTCERRRGKPARSRSCGRMSPSACSVTRAVRPAAQRRRSRSRSPR